MQIRLAFSAKKTKNVCFQHLILSNSYLEISYKI